MSCAPSGRAILLALLTTYLSHCRLAVRLGSPTHFFAALPLPRPRNRLVPLHLLRPFPLHHLLLLNRLLLDPRPTHILDVLPIRPSRSHSNSLRGLTIHARRRNPDTRVLAGFQEGVAEAHVSGCSDSCRTHSRFFQLDTIAFRGTAPMWGLVGDFVGRHSPPRICLESLQYVPDQTSVLSKLVYIRSGTEIGEDLPKAAAAAFHVSEAHRISNERLTVIWGGYKRRPVAAV